MNKRTVNIRLSEEEYAMISNEASNRHLSVQEYGRMKLLDNNDGVEGIKRKIITRMPEYYNKVSEIEDKSTGEWFYSFGGALCRALK